MAVCRTGLGEFCKLYKISDFKFRSISTSFDGPTPCLFLLIFVFSNTNFTKKCVLQHDSNLDCRSRRRAHWPLDIHHTTAQPLFFSYFYLQTKHRRWWTTYLPLRSVRGFFSVDKAWRLNGFPFQIWNRKNSSSGHFCWVTFCHGPLEDFFLFIYPHRHSRQLQLKEKGSNKCNCLPKWWSGGRDSN